jgi:hypothetical protein
MSCLPPDQMPPSDPNHQILEHVVVYPHHQVGVDLEQRSVAIVLSPLPSPPTHASVARKVVLPALECDEKATAKLIHQLQQCLLTLRQLPPREVLPYD